MLSSLPSDSATPGSQNESTVRPVPYLVSPLPDRHALATEKILASFGAGSVDGKDSRAIGDSSARSSRHDPNPASVINFDHCLYRGGHQEPASSYIIRNAGTQSRTIVNYNDLAEMTTEEFVKIANTFAEKPDGSVDDSWWHFEVS